MHREQLGRRLHAPPETGHALVAEALRQRGVQRVFGVSGVPVHEIFSEGARRGIRPFGMRHQQAATLAAAAGNFIAGRLDSVVVTSAGPAVTNTLTGVLTARDNGWPLVVLGGRSSLQWDGLGAFQELDAIPIFEPVTKWAACVKSTSALMDSVLQACRIATEGRPGPVYLDLPQDILSGSASTTAEVEPLLESRPEAGAEEVEAAAKLLMKSARPLLVLGEGIRWAYDRASLDRLTTGFEIPFITAPLGRGLLPDSHPQCQNKVRHWVQSQADLVIMAGARFDWRFRFGAELTPGMRIIHVDVDPATLGCNVPGALMIRADAGQFVTQLAQALVKSGPGPIPARFKPWHQQLQRARQDSDQERAGWLVAESQPMLAQQVFRALTAVAPADALVVLDGSICLATGQKVLSAEREWSWLDPGWGGCMGSGIPFGIGAKLAQPDRPVIVACGDFAFGINAMEMETAVRHRIPIVVVVVNNDGILGSTRQASHFPPDYPELFSQFLPALRYERLMDAFGGHAEWVEEARDLQPALERALQSNRPACLNVRVKPGAPHPGSW